MNIKSTLGGLSDVEGVIGSFVITDAGALVGSNLPAIFDAELFAEAGPRIVRLVESSTAIADGLRACVLRFSEHKLFVKQLDGAFLGVLLTTGGSLPALKIAANIVTRRLGAMLAQGLLVPEMDASGPSTLAPPSVPSPLTPPPPSVQPASGVPTPGMPSAGRKMFYRGNPVG